MSALITKHHGISIYVSEGLAVLLLGFALLRVCTQSTTVWQTSFVIISFFLYLFIRVCKMKRWHKQAPRGAGIEKHFADVHIVSNYILLFGLGTFLLLAHVWPLLIATGLLFFCIHFHLVLLALARRDRDPTPINFYSLV